MCNEFQRHKLLQDAIEEFARRGLPLFRWKDGQIPNMLDAQPSIRIRDSAFVVRGGEDGLVGTMMTWAWPGPRGAPVFNFRSEGRDFSRSDRVLVMADGFFEYTAPSVPGVKLKDRHLFTMAGQEWFWIAGVVKEGCFSLLTTAPGPDVAAYHDRQIVTFAPADGLAWLSLSQPEKVLFRPPPASAFEVRTLRRDGVDQAA
ncbi:SOS response-associated peptidase family protein [Phenylobacterium sp.]|uniref:SOS response-associated peptidase family protein n=1 Tax=Phenylobacterium sp. TaxID=1871053 RepID=UPI0028A247B0|nr:SOS response-associated peptidase family protein [Phenylobacterium sp.]